MIILYSHNIWNFNPAGYRNTLTRSMISDFAPDVCTFQECGPQSCRVGNPDIVSLMSDVYSEATPEFADVNYTPVFYKKEKFNLVDKGYLVYDGLNDVNSKSVTWAVLEDKETKKKYAFASTHFWWMFESEKDNEQRLKNVDQLKAVCDDIIKKYGSVKEGAALLFNSVSFAIFLPVVFTLYWAVPKKGQWIILFLSSYLFYMC